MILTIWIQHLPYKIQGERAARPLTTPVRFSIDFFAGEGARATLRHDLCYENELPQPQDFVEFGFTNTKPCCIRVSW